MKVIKNLLLALCITTLLNGCASRIKTPYPKVVTVDFVKHEEPPTPIILSKNIESFYTAGGGIFAGLSNMYFVLYEGEYTLVAQGNGGKYYRHKGKGPSMKNMGITEHRPGGFKKPDDPSGKWCIWNTPNYHVAIPFAGGSTTAKAADKSQVVERNAINDISEHLSGINKTNQRFEAIVKTPGESGKEQGTAGHP